jgi:uncharacterized membrane protein YjgN (DUF898 family)
MSDNAQVAAGAATPTLHTFEFRGSGGEYFRIWIVNIALTIITLGIYSAWAKVRTVRYFRGNIFLAGHPFDYHASPVRILIGRAIALVIFLGYGISARIHPYAVAAWLIVFLFALPWLVVSSLRFNARNTSYRNVRFNFVGSLGGAAYAYILWPILAIFSLLTVAPLAQRVRDYFYINNHTFGGKHFFTEFSGWSIYRLYLLGIAMYLGLFAIMAVPVSIIVVLSKGTFSADPKAMGSILALPLFVLYPVLLYAIYAIPIAIHTMTINLALGNTTLDGRHELRSELGPFRLAWIFLSNAVLVLFTIGFFYPWAQVRMVRYQAAHLKVLAMSNLDEFTSEAVATQGAIGEEIASFFDIGIGL